MHALAMKPSASSVLSHHFCGGFKSPFTNVRCVKKRKEPFREEVVRYLQNTSSLSSTTTANLWITLHTQNLKEYRKLENKKAPWVGGQATRGAK